MAPKDPPSDDLEPNAEAEAVDATDDAHLTASESEAVDAEIVADDQETQTLNHDEDPPNVETAIPSETETAGSNGSLAGPFGIIIGALIVIALLIIFLNRDNDAQTAGGKDTARTVTSVTETTPTGTSANTVAVIPPSEADASTSASNALLTRAEALQAVATEGEEAIADAVTEAVIAAETTNTSETIQVAKANTAENAADMEGNTVSAASSTIAAMTQGDSLADTDDSSEQNAPTSDEFSKVIETAQTATGDEASTVVTKAAETVVAEANETVIDETAAVVVAEISEDVQAVIPVLNPDAQAEGREVEGPAEVSVAAPTPISPTPTTSESPAQTDDLISARLDDFKSSVTEDVRAETEQVINQALGKTERDVAELRTQLSAQTELQREANERLADLSSKIETIQTSDLTTARQSTLLLALSDLSDSIESGQPFVRELETVEGITPNARELSVLRRFANEGLPTTTTLRQHYQEAARNALSGVKRAEANGPMERFFANMSGLFTVRKVGDVEGDSLSAIIARAENRLENDDLRSALRELRKLDGSAKDAFDEWISSAEAKVDAQRRIEALEKAISSSRAG